MGRSRTGNFEDLGRGGAGGRVFEDSARFTFSTLAVVVSLLVLGTPCLQGHEARMRAPLFSPALPCGDAAAFAPPLGLPLAALGVLTSSKNSACNAYHASERQKLTVGSVEKSVETRRVRGGLCGAGMMATASAADGVRAGEQERVWRAVGGADEEKGEAVNIVSYNVLGPKQALTDKHAYSNFKWRKWPYRKERIFAELRAYDADVVCLQEVTPDTFINDFAPFMKEIGLDKGIYTPKRLPDGEKSSRGPFRRPNKGKRLAPELFGAGTHMCLVAILKRALPLKMAI